MSGEEISKTDKASEIWYRLLLDEKFKNDLAQLKEYKNELAYYFRQHLLFQKYGILTTQRLLNLCDRYVFGKMSAENLGDHFPIRLQTPSTDELKQSGRAFVKLWVYEGVSREEILNFVKKNWKKLQIILESQGLPKSKRVKTIKNKKQTELILQYNKLSTKQLLERAADDGEKSQYREILIGRLLKKDGYKMSPESIKRVISRFNKEHKSRPH